MYIVIIVEEWNCNVCKRIVKSLVVDKEQFWRMMCCSRIIGKHLHKNSPVESVRMRISTFIVSNPREIENAICEIPWEKYITKNDNITLRTVEPPLTLHS